MSFSILLKNELINKWINDKSCVKIIPNFYHFFFHINKTRWEADEISQKQWQMI